MFYRKISANSLNTKRLDSDFYRPEYLVIDEVLSHLNCVKLGSIGHFFTGPFGSKLPSSLYVEEGIPLFRVANVGQFEVITESFVYLAPKSHEELKASEVLPGDLLIVKASVGEKICKIPESLPKANITQHIIAIRPKNYMDIDYISTFLFSYYGVGQLQRYSLGSIIQYLGVTDTKNVSLYYPHLVAQKYIGDKVRQAEQLRAWAKYTQTNANDLIPAYINEIERYQHKSYRTVKINSGRLDSLFYHPDYIALESKMKSKGCKNLGLIATLIKQAWDKKRADNFEYFEIGGLNIGTGQVASANIETSSAPSRAKTKVQQGDVLVSTVRPNRKNVGFIIENANDVEMVATSGFSVLRFSSLKEAAFYHAWLRTDDATSQLMRWNSGSAYPAIDDNVPLNIIVPEFDKDFIDEWGQKLLDAQFAYVYAKQLTSAAKTLVEALIEGQLTEEQLIQAQQALDDGDNTLDKAILSKLSSEGYAVEGATPLFSDIDELYRLLASATTADSED